MLAPVTVTISQRGVMTLPKEMRDTYQLEPGDEMTLIDLGGVFVLSPGRSKLGALADQVANALTAKGETLESMLTALVKSESAMAVARAFLPGDFLAWLKQRLAGA